MPERPTVICVTPIRNEAWILDRFLACASLWADHIIIADQCSDDGSREIAAGYPKVTVIDNPCPAYDEAARQRLLLAAARRIPGPRVIIALDADEALTANWASSAEWERVLAAAPGTVIFFRWVNLQPDPQTCWVPPVDMPLGFVDDGSEHQGTALHSTRIPLPAHHTPLVLSELKLLHYQHTDWARMKSKQRWYQCWETLNNPSFSPLEGHRLYHRMDAVPAEQVQPVAAEWLAGYERLGIDMTSVRRDPSYWWDREVVGMFRKYGTRKFRKLDIWDVDWSTLAAQCGAGGEALRDPRGWSERAVHSWLRRTQRAPMWLGMRVVQRLLREAGW
jgi:hypothetical protein